MDNHLLNTIMAPFVQPSPSSSNRSASPTAIRSQHHHHHHHSPPLHSHLANDEFPSDPQSSPRHQPVISGSPPISSPISTSGRTTQQSTQRNNVVFSPPPATVRSVFRGPSTQRWSSTTTIVSTPSDRPQTPSSLPSTPFPSLSPAIPFFPCTSSLPPFSPAGPSDISTHPDSASPFGSHSPPCGRTGCDSQCIDNVHFNDLFHGNMSDSSSVAMPHSIRNDPRLYKDDVDIRFSRTLNSCKLPQIRYASPERLFERLTDLRFLSIDFLNTFLLTYRVFTDGVTVLEALKKVHYNPEANSGLSGAMGGAESSGGSLDELKQDGPDIQLEYDYMRRVSNTSTVSADQSDGGQDRRTSGNSLRADAIASVIAHPDLIFSKHRSSVISATSSTIGDGSGGSSIVLGGVSSGSNAQLQQQSMFQKQLLLYRNNQHWRLSFRKFEEEQARERYMRKFGERLAQTDSGGESESGAGESAVVRGWRKGSSATTQRRTINSAPPSRGTSVDLPDTSDPQQTHSLDSDLGRRCRIGSICMPVSHHVSNSQTSSTSPPLSIRTTVDTACSTLAAVLDTAKSSTNQFITDVQGQPISGTWPAEESSAAHRLQLPLSSELSAAGFALISPAGDPFVPLPPPPSPVGSMYALEQKQSRNRIKSSSSAEGDSSAEGEPASRTGSELSSGYTNSEEDSGPELDEPLSSSSESEKAGDTSAAVAEDAVRSDQLAALRQTPNQPLTPKLLGHSTSSDTLKADQLSAPNSPTVLSSAVSLAASSTTLIGSIDSKCASPKGSPVRKHAPARLQPFPSQPTTTTTSTGPAPISPLAKQPADNTFQQTTSTGLAVEQIPKQCFSTCSVKGRESSTTLTATTTANTNIRESQEITNSARNSIASFNQMVNLSSARSSLTSGGSPLRGAGGGGSQNQHRLSTASSASTNYLRVRGAGSKRGSGDSQLDPGSGRSSFQTDTSLLASGRSSFQHSDATPMISSKAGVVVTGSRQSTRRSSTASAASAFAVATAASSNPVEPISGMMPGQQTMNASIMLGSCSRASSRLPSIVSNDMKYAYSGPGGGSISGASGAAAAGNVVGGSAGGSSGSLGAGGGGQGAGRMTSKRESVISTAATMRVLNVLRHWISKHNQDFENDLKLLQMTSDFLEELVHNPNLLPAEHKAACQLLQMISKEDNNNNIVSGTSGPAAVGRLRKLDLDVLLYPPLEPSAQTVETLNALEIAENMTFLDHHIFISIHSSEFLCQAWMKPDKAKKAPHILLMTRRFNEMSKLVASEIVQAQDMSRRVAIIEKWAAVADICRCLHNFNGVLQICSAFTNSSVFRLKRTWDKVNKTQKQIIDKLQSLISADGRFRNMREALHRCDPPCIPYLGMYLTDLSFIEEGTPNYTDEGLLNFSKMRMIAHVIREIRTLQQTPYKIEMCPKMVNYLLDTSRHKDDDDLYQISLCLEPRLSRLGTKITLTGGNTSPSGYSGNA